jgi:hypothetical protein
MWHRICALARSLLSGGPLDRIVEGDPAMAAARPRIAEQIEPPAEREAAQRSHHLGHGVRSINTKYVAGPQNIKPNTSTIQAIRTIGLTGAG